VSAGVCGSGMRVCFCVCVLFEMVQSQKTVEEVELTRNLAHISLTDDSGQQIEFEMKLDWLTNSKIVFDIMHTKSCPMLLNRVRATVEQIRADTGLETGVHFVLCNVRGKRVMLIELQRKVDAGAHQVKDMKGKNVRVNTFKHWGVPEFLILSGVFPFGWDDVFFSVFLWEKKYLSTTYFPPVSMLPSLPKSTSKPI